MPYGTLLSDVVQSSAAGTPPQFNDGNSVQVGTLCRAWVNTFYNGSSMTIRASFNVSSITYSSTGNFIINMTSALPDATYGVVGTSDTSASASTVMINSGYSRTTSSFQLYLSTPGGAQGNPTTMLSVAVFR
jgi:hypothetical protein